MRGEALLAPALTGYGHFTTMRVVDGCRVRGLDLHLARLVRDSRALFGTEPDTDRIRRYVRRAVARHHGAAVTDAGAGAGAVPDGDVMVRVTLFDPELDIVRPATEAEPRVLVTVRPAPASHPAPLRVRTTRHLRDLPTVKHISLLGTLHARRSAQLDGWDDVLFVDPEGHVTEGATWNVGFVRDDSVVWPCGESLPGVTSELLRRTDPGCGGTTVGVEQLPQMTAAFATNAGVGVRPLAAVDDVSFDTGHPVLDRLRRAYLSVDAQPL